MAQHILVFGVRVYRLFISPAKAVLFGPLSHCRFTPSCSAYALEAISRHGARCGAWLALKRICRCHPWGGCGDDPVPAVLPAHHPTAKAGATTDSECPRGPGRFGQGAACSSPHGRVQEAFGEAVVPGPGH